MIFVIVGGVVEFDFSRMIKLLDELCEEGIIDSKKLKAQIGHCKYAPKNFEYYRFVDGQQFRKDISDADVIITHGGVGTLVRALKDGKKVIVFPRLKQFKEHLDDHQIEIANEYRRKGYCMLATDRNELAECIKLANEFTPNQFVSDNSKMVNIITNYLDNLK